MKKFKDMSLEETMVKVYADIKVGFVKEIIFTLALTILVLYQIFTRDETVFKWVIIFAIILPIIGQSNSNSKAISKLYEKIKKDDKSK